MKRDADETIVRLLRDRAEPGSPVGPCLDAEILAAWFDGTLAATEQRDAESHASTCARCQALLATMAQAEPAGPPPHRSLSLVRWLAPALVAATAVLVWINVTGRTQHVTPVRSSSAPASVPASNTPMQQTKAPQVPVKAMPPVANAKVQQKSSGRSALDASANELSAPSPNALEERVQKPQAAPTRSREAAPTAAPAPMTADRGARLKDQANAALERDALADSAALPPIVRSSDGSLWRITADGTVGHSTDNGITWQEQRLGSPARLLAGSSPSPNVVWFAGAAGVVLVTADGVGWQRRSLPERVDVTAIAAVDGQTATATLRDGRRFVTHDGGLTWVPAAPQENPAAPF